MASLTNVQTSEIYRLAPFPRLKILAGQSLDSLLNILLNYQDAKDPLSLKLLNWGFTIADRSQETEIFEETIISEISQLESILNQRSELLDTHPFASEISSWISEVKNIAPEIFTALENRCSREVTVVRGLQSLAEEFESYTLMFKQINQNLEFELAKQAEILAKEQVDQQLKLNQSLQEIRDTHEAHIELMQSRLQGANVDLENSNHRLTQTKMLLQNESRRAQSLIYEIGALKRRVADLEDTDSCVVL